MYPTTIADNIKIELELGVNGEHRIFIFDKTTKVGLSIPADQFLQVAIDVCAPEFETIVAKRHLQRQGYRVSQPSKLAEMFGL